MTFDTYKEAIIKRAKSTKIKEDAFSRLLELCKNSIKDYYGFESISVRPDNDPNCPFDIWGIDNKTLYLIKVDESALLRDDSFSVGREELSEIFPPLVTFVGHCAETCGVRGSDNIRSMIAELISKLAHGETDSDIDQVKIVPFVLNEIDSNCSRELSLHFNLLKCLSQPLSLYSIWQKGLPLPWSDNEKDDLESESTVCPAESKTSGDQNDFLDSLKQFATFSTEPKEDGTAVVGSLKEIMLSEARGSGLTHYNLFNQICHKLTEVGEYEEIYEAHCNTRTYLRKQFSIDGWTQDEVSNIVTLFLLDPDTSDSSFTKADGERLCSRLKNFAELSFRDLLADTILDLSTDEGSLSNSLYRAYQDHCNGDRLINRLDLVVVTLRRKNIRTDLITDDCMGIPCRYSVIDIQDIQEREESIDSSLIRIDFLSDIFGGLPIQMLQTVDRPDIGYKSYVGKIRADVLASLYEEFGQKVLSSNVRAFLLTQGKVNKGIQKTIKDEPDNFFAYNNGICVVASAIDAEDRSGVTLMTSATDFQIVNGGQTTASLHYAAKKKIPIKKIYVPMKLSVVPVESDNFDRDIFVQNISAYANSQNKVSDSDLGTNTQFQIQFQRAGEQSVLYRNDRSLCRWYYERARGTYRIEKLRTQSGTSSKNSQFLVKYPQKFDKTDMAKWMKAWSDQPYIANVGGQKCFIDFSKDLVKKEEEDGLDFCTQEFFKYVVGKGILFRHIDLMVSSSDWYKVNRSYKINTVGYTMGLLKVVCDQLFENCEINFLKIWETQNIPQPKDKITTFDSLSEDIAEIIDPILDVLTRYTRDIFNHDARTVDDVGEWVKKLDCWKLMTKEIPDLSEYASDLRKIITPIREEFVIKSWREK